MKRDQARQGRKEKTELPAIMDYVLDSQSPFIDIDSEETLAEISARSQLWTRTCHMLYSGSGHAYNTTSTSSPVSLDVYWSDQAVILEWFGLLDSTVPFINTSMPVSTERSTVDWVA